LTYVGITNSLGGLALLALGGTTLLLILQLLPATRVRLVEELAGEQRGLLGAGWVVASAAMGGSLYFSEVVGFTPCPLCWYQRIAMYPLVLILGVATLTSDARVWKYVLPLAITGGLVALYHIGIQMRPALDIGFCTTEAPCTVRHVAAFGWVSIPVMSAIAFLSIAAFTMTARQVAELQQGS
jgi:disulfide bond formation protein DsbB